MAISGTFEFGTGDATIGQKFKSFKGEKDTTYRMSFVWFPIKEGKFDLSAPSPTFIGNETHYIPNVGYIINKGPEYTKLTGEPPKQRIGAIICQWPTDKKGNIQKERVQSGDFEVMPWIFSGDKFNQLKSIHTEFGFGTHDLKAVCSDAQYQKMTFTPCSDSLLANFNNAFATSPKAKELIGKIVNAVQDLVPKMQGNIGREMTIAQIREKLAGGGGSITAGAGAVEDAAASGKIDDIVDSLLDG